MQYHRLRNKVFLVIVKIRGAYKLYNEIALNDLQLQYRKKFFATTQQSILRKHHYFVNIYVGKNNISVEYVTKFLNRKIVKYQIEFRTNFQDIADAYGSTTMFSSAGMLYFG